MYRQVHRSRPSHGSFPQYLDPGGRRLCRSTPSFSSSPSTLTASASLLPYWIPCSLTSDVGQGDKVSVKNGKSDGPRDLRFFSHMPLRLIPGSERKELGKGPPRRTGKHMTGYFCSFRVCLVCWPRFFFLKGRSYWAQLPRHRPALAGQQTS